MTGGSGSSGLGKLFGEARSRVRCQSMKDMCLSMGERQRQVDWRCSCSGCESFFAFDPAEVTRVPGLDERGAQSMNATFD